MKLVLDLFNMFLFIHSNVTQMLTCTLFFERAVPYVFVTLFTSCNLCMHNVAPEGTGHVQRQHPHECESHPVCSVLPFATLSQVPKMQPAGRPSTVPTTDYIICSGAIEIDPATSTWKCAKYPNTDREWDLTSDTNPHPVMFSATKAYTPAHESGPSLPSWPKGTLATGRNGGTEKKKWSAC